MTGRRGHLQPALLAVAVAFGALSAALPGLSNAADPRIESELSAREVKVGDRFVAIYRITAEGGVLAADFADRFDPGSFELLDRRQIEVGSDGSGPRGVGIELSLVAWETGPASLPAQRLNVTLPDGSKRELTAGAFDLTVVSVIEQEAREAARQAAASGPPAGSAAPDPNRPQPGAPDPTGQPFEYRPDFKPPRPVRPLLVPDLTPLWFGLGLLGVAGVVLSLWLWNRRRRQRSGVAGGQGPPPPPAWEEALARLSELEAQNLVARRQLREFHEQLADILKHYLGRLYAINAPEMTTAELLAWFGGHYQANLDERPLREVLGQCDLVKFAKVEPDDPSALRLPGIVRLVVERTRPSGGAHAA